MYLHFLGQTEHGKKADQSNGGEENHFVVRVVYCMLDASTELSNHYSVYYIDSTWDD